MCPVTRINDVQNAVCRCFAGRHIASVILGSAQFHRGGDGCFINFSDYPAAFGWHWITFRLGPVPPVRRPQKGCGQNPAAVDPLLDPGDPPHRCPARPATDPAGAHQRLVHVGEGPTNPSCSVLISSQRRNCNTRLYDRGAPQRPLAAPGRNMRSKPRSHPASEDSQDTSRFLGRCDRS